jgi:hypothetical protein
MGVFQNLINRKFGRLTVVSLNRTTGRTGPPPRGTFWNCRCDCGNATVVLASALKRKETRSCGCLRNEMRPILRRTHGQSRKTAAYRAWLNMKRRCLRPQCDKFKFYGGRGIKIHQPWIESFEAFFADVGPRPGPGYSLDRYPDNDGDYRPGNIRWATKAEQSGNRRDRTDFPIRNRHGRFRRAIGPLGIVLDRIAEEETA